MGLFEQALPQLPSDESLTVGEDRLATLYWSNLNLEEINELSATTPLREYTVLCERVTKLELFMYCPSDPSHLMDYPHLQELSLHLQTLPRQVKIMNMLSLQRLCMTECGLVSMGGLARLPSLTHLDLSQNSIARMDEKVFLGTPKLKTLWMNENQIRRIEGLEALSMLRTLWLGRNLITMIGNSLEKNAALEELMVAGNMISNFKDIPVLGRMRSLTSIAFSAPADLRPECPPSP